MGNLLKIIQFKIASQNPIWILSINHQNSILVQICSEVQLERFIKVIVSICLQIEHVDIFLVCDVVICAVYELINLIRPRANVLTKLRNPNVINHAGLWVIL